MWDRVSQTIDLELQWVSHPYNFFFTPIAFLLTKEQTKKGKNMDREGWCGWGGKVFVHVRIFLSPLLFQNKFICQTVNCQAVYEESFLPFQKWDLKNFTKVTSMREKKLSLCTSSIDGSKGDTGVWVLVVCYWGSSSFALKYLTNWVSEQL